MDHRTTARTQARNRDFACHSLSLLTYAELSRLHTWAKIVSQQLTSAPSYNHLRQLYVIGRRGARAYRYPAKTSRSQNQKNQVRRIRREPEYYLHTAVTSHIFALNRVPCSRGPVIPPPIRAIPFISLSAGPRSHAVATRCTREMSVGKR